MSLDIWSPSKGEVNLAVIYTHAGAPTNGTAGTLAGQAGPMDLLADITNKNLYYNSGTSSSPTWTQITLP